MTRRAIITSGDIAEMLGLQSAWSFLNKRKELEASGFPQRVSWSKNPFLWKRAEVEFWIEHEREIVAELEAAKAAGATYDTENVVMMAKARVA
jgi:predicted DNA-binding transcriptional regulator AlpA